MSLSQHTRQLLLSRHVRGASKEEIAAAEAVTGHTIAEQYREFLTIAGHGGAHLWMGSHFRIDDLASMQTWAREMISESLSEVPPLPLCVWMHQGYIAFFLQDGKVFHCSDSKPTLTVAFNSFEAFLVEMISD
jgi:hypothetical protein